MDRSKIPIFKLRRWCPECHAVDGPVTKLPSPDPHARIYDCNVCGSRIQFKSLTTPQIKEEKQAHQEWVEKNTQTDDPYSR